MKYVEIDKETGEVVAGIFVAETLPVFNEDFPRVAKEVVDAPDPFVWGGQTYDEETKSLNDSQVSLSKKALSYLAMTEWYVTRFAETGTAIPDDVKAKRAKARTLVMDSHKTTPEMIGDPNFQQAGHAEPTLGD